jgi:hypothetical protein
MNTNQKTTRSLAAIARAICLAAALPVLAAWAPAAAAQSKTFPTPEAAMDAFGDALARSDDDAMTAILGARWRDYVPPVGAEARYRFLGEWARTHSIRPDGDGRARIAVGNDGWTLPIPLVRAGSGWRFDLRQGADEMRIRRIGRNERAVMQVMLAIVDAQKDYATLDPDGNGLPDYARKLASSPGRKDGLYWPTVAGQPPSPLGPAVDAARRKSGGGDVGYYGYRYKLLTAQGSNAPGGAYDYVVGGRLVGGFAIVAWPVRWGDTGVMTFMVDHDGRLFERDLGPDTASRVEAIRRFDPGPGWRPVEPD